MSKKYISEVMKLKISGIKNPTLEGIVTILLEKGFITEEEIDEGIQNAFAEKERRIKEEREERNIKILY